MYARYSSMIIVAALAGATPAFAQKAAAPTPLPNVSHYATPASSGLGAGGNGEFPGAQGWSDLYAKSYSRQASYGHTKEVDAANDASILIDKGDCAGAKALLLERKQPDMAARVGGVCHAK